jgi:hypothetical protein
MKDWGIIYKEPGNLNSPDNMRYVLKLSTGERFYNGDIVWHDEYQNQIGPIRFDAALTGTEFFGKFYEGYVRADSGLYHISEISALRKTSKQTNLDRRLLL